MDNQIWQATEAEFRRRFVEASQRFHEADSTFVISATANSETFNAALLNKRTDAAEEMGQILKEWNLVAYNQLAMNGR